MAFARLGANLDFLAVEGVLAIVLIGHEIFSAISGCIRP